jgi:hypothetical protein
LCDICSDSGIPVPGGREFVRQCVYYLITWDLLIPAAFILIIVLISFFISHNDKGQKKGDKKDD